MDSNSTIVLREYDPRSFFFLIYLFGFTYTLFFLYPEVMEEIDDIFEIVRSP